MRKGVSHFGGLERRSDLTVGCNPPNVARTPGEMVATMCIQHGDG